MAHTYGDLDFDDLTWESRKYNKMRAYGDSKIANLYFTYELAIKLAEKGSSIKVTESFRHPNNLERYFFSVNFNSLKTLRA